ncbi:MAG: polysaccharide biosynthesis tyrosine autokinase [Deltaproteobacteria bacterium]|nr:polysaccharide biosynthesis tyrosine autokinase [Deltaproteobacteria bacterium]
MELRLIWKIIKRRKWIIIEGFFAVFLGVIFWSMIVKPTYEAKAKILVGDPSQSLSSLLSSLGIGAKSAMPSSDASLKMNMENQMNLAVLSRLVDKVALKLQLRDSDGEMYPAEKLLDQQMVSLSPRPYISVSSDEDTSIVELTADSTDPVQAQMIVTAVAELYLNDTLQRTRDGYTSAKKFIEQQMDGVRANYINALKEFENEKKRQKSIDLKSESTQLIQNIEKLTSDQITYARKRYELEASISGIRNQMKDMEKFQKTLVEFENNPIIDELKKNLYKAITDIQGLKTKYTDQHPEVIELSNKISETKGLIQKEVEKTFNRETVSIDPVYAELVKKLATQYISLEETKAQEQAIPLYIKVYESRLVEMPEKEMAQTQLQDDLDATRKVYESLLGYLHQVGVAEAMTISDIQVVEAPVKPDDPVSPNKKLFALIGAVMGVFVGLGFGFLFEHVDNTVKEPDDIKNYDLPFLGSIPHFSAAAKRCSDALVSKTDTNDPRYESYRGVLTGISFTDMDKGCKKLLVTSVGPKEGKSMTVANLGVIYSSEGKRTLLVDMDLRRPKLHQYFDLPNSRGLTDVLIGNAALDDAILETGVKGLSVLPSGAAPPDPGQVLKSQKLKQITEELAKNYDIVLFDSAPILIKNDAVSLMSHLDKVVIVIRNNITTHQGISRANDILKGSKITPLGVILNDVYGRQI